MLFQQFVIDPIVLVALLILRHYGYVSFQLFETRDLGE